MVSIGRDCKKKTSKKKYKQNTPVQFSFFKLAT